MSEIGREPVKLFGLVEQGLQLFTAQATTCAKPLAVFFDDSPRGSIRILVVPFVMAHYHTGFIIQQISGAYPQSSRYFLKPGLGKALLAGFETRNCRPGRVDALR